MANQTRSFRRKLQRDADKVAKETYHYLLSELAKAIALAGMFQGRFGPLDEPFMQAVAERLEKDTDALAVKDHRAYFEEIVRIAGEIAGETK